MEEILSIVGNFKSSTQYNVSLAVCLCYVHSFYFIYKMLLIHNYIENEEKLPKWHS